MKKRLLILMLIISIMLCACDAVSDDQVLGAYSDAETNEQTDGHVMTDITLLYYPDMDVNPVTTTCLANNQLLKLVYQPLIELDDSFKPTAVIAESFEQSGNTVTVKLKSGLKFSNGEPVTAYHAVKSFDAAKTSDQSPYYSSVLKMSKYYAEDDSTFVCVFKTVFADAAGLLDIPVMYNGKEGVGCGPYRLSEQNGKAVLVINDYYPQTPKVSVLHLTETKKDEYITSLFSAGELDVVSIPGNNDLSLTSLRDYSIVNYPSNNMIYIGVNTASEVFASAEIRCAISDCIDRSRIAQQELVGLASPTVYPFNPDWYKFSVYNVDSNPKLSESDTLNARQRLLDIKLTMLVPDNSDVKTAVARAVAEQFKVIGITLELNIADSETYAAAVAAGNFDLYLGETAVPRTMDPTYLYSVGGSMNYCGYSNAELDAAYASYTAGESGIDVYLKMFSECMPVIPVVFRKNVIYSAGSIEGWSCQSAWNGYGSFETVYIKK